MTIPLDGVKVLDLSTGIAGPYATKLLADAGADVLKIESPDGDPMRRWKASAALGRSSPLEPGEDGAFFRFLNTSKRSAVLDLTAPRDRGVLLALAAEANLVVESDIPGDLDALGAGYGALSAANPEISLVSVTPWGQEGPYAKRPATEFTLQAETGSIAYRGYADRPPVAAGGSIGEYVSGAYAAVGALAALLNARKTGHGEHVDVSTFEAMLLSFQTFQYIHALFEPGVPAPRNVEVPSIEPASDGWVGFCTITGQQWKDFCLVIDRPDLAEESELLTKRFENMDRVLAAIHEWTRQHTVAEAIEKSELLRVPVAPVGDGRRVLEVDHFVERGVFVENPAGFKQPRVPYRLGVGDNRAFSKAPSLGEHTETVRREAASVDGGSHPVAGPKPTGPPRPLDGIVVADFSAFWAGPVAASAYAALGADVIKIESIQRPDGMRFASGITPKEGQVLWELSPVFHGSNTGKRAITLDLEREDGVSLARQLIEKADIVIENFSPRVIERFGLGWEQVHALNPNAIMVRMPAFGLDGPWRDRTGFAMTIEQATGLAWTTGYPDRAPLVPRGSCDPLGGMTTVFATLLALEVRRLGGGGQLLEVPLVEVGLNAAAEQVAEWTAYGELLERDANRGPGAAPQGVYAAADGQDVAIAVASDAQWEALADVLADFGGSSVDWVRSPSLASAGGRRAAHDDIDERLAACIAGRDAEDWADALTAAGVPSARLRNAREIRPHAHLDSRGFFVTLDHPVVGAVGYPSFPMRFSGAYLPVRTPPPTLGQHNEVVLREVLGLDDPQIEKLRADEVIGERPTFM